MGFLQALPTKGLCQESTTHMSYFGRLGMQESWYWRAEEKLTALHLHRTFQHSYPILSLQGCLREKETAQERLRQVT